MKRFTMLFALLMVTLMATMAMAATVYEKDIHTVEDLNKIIAEGYKVGHGPEDGEKADGGYRIRPSGVEFVTDGTKLDVLCGSDTFVAPGTTLPVSSDMYVFFKNIEPDPTEPDPISGDATLAIDYPKHGDVEQENDLWYTIIVTSEDLRVGKDVFMYDPAWNLVPENTVIKAGDPMIYNYIIRTYISWFNPADQNELTWLFDPSKPFVQHADILPKNIKTNCFSFELIDDWDIPSEVTTVEGSRIRIKCGTAILDNGEEAGDKYLTSTLIKTLKKGSQVYVEIRHVNLNPATSDGGGSGGCDAGFGLFAALFAAFPILRKKN